MGSVGDKTGCSWKSGREKWQKGKDGAVRQTVVSLRLFDTLPGDVTCAYWQERERKGAIAVGTNEQRNIGYAGREVAWDKS